MSDTQPSFLEQHFFNRDSPLNSKPNIIMGLIFNGCLLYLFTRAAYSNESCYAVQVSTNDEWTAFAVPTLSDDQEDFEALPFENDEGAEDWEPGEEKPAKLEEEDEIDEALNTVYYGAGIAAGTALVGAEEIGGMVANTTLSEVTAGVGAGLDSTLEYVNGTMINGIGVNATESNATDTTLEDLTAGVGNAVGTTLGEASVFIGNATGIELESADVMLGDAIDTALDDADVLLGDAIDTTVNGVDVITSTTEEITLEDIDEAINATLEDVDAFVGVATNTTLNDVAAGVGRAFDSTLDYANETLYNATNTTVDEVATSVEAAI